VKLAKTLGLNLKSYRTARGLSQEALAWEAGLHPNFVGRVERGQETISLANLERLAKVLKVQPYRLLVPTSVQG
jgi:transcriptional regulator with XRE-family HTH domain